LIALKRFPIAPTFKQWHNRKTFQDFGTGRKAGNATSAPGRRHLPFEIRYAILKIAWEKVFSQ
jgi:hypothetical protein